MYPEIEVRVEPNKLHHRIRPMQVPVNPLHGDRLSDEECLVMLKVRSPRKIGTGPPSGYSQFHLWRRCSDGERVYHGDDIPERCDYMSVMFARRA